MLEAEIYYQPFYQPVTNLLFVTNLLPRCWDARSTQGHLLLCLVEDLGGLEIVDSSANE